ncbi:hypothetical protein SDC9_149363 [bioreactor metagenome]|uniref:Uncharacterized protein n=1 Tax=bioreactor metagenome TaxID=1076179 RepID=A0A645ELE3_9ZZZZ
MKVIESRGWWKLGMEVYCEESFGGDYGKISIIVGDLP